MYIIINISYHICCLLYHRNLHVHANALTKLETIKNITLDIYNHQLQSHLLQSLPSPLYTITIHFKNRLTTTCTINSTRSNHSTAITTTSFNLTNANSTAITTTSFNLTNTNSTTIITIGVGKGGLAELNAPPTPPPPNFKWTRYYLMSRMTQEQLNHVMLLHTHTKIGQMN